MADMDLVVKKSYFPTKVYLVGFFSRPSIYGWWQMKEWVWMNMKQQWWNG